MGAFFAYARVSTPRQGEKGVSLSEQREAIERYARSHGFVIARWFEERESASQRGRPAFSEMLRLLRRATAQGVIIHKIDRSARNLEDWADIGKLVDAGVEIHFATENLDLRTVAGRLSADIQAVVAAHYSRNLREEVKKGIYGRLKQGFYPLPAPLGYLDQGAAKPKIPDPVSAPLVREAFRLYRSGRYSLRPLAEEMFRRGLRNRRGKPVKVNRMADILKNPFYVGLMQIRRSGQTFAGSHLPLVTTETFEAVQALLAGKRADQRQHLTFRFSRIVRCATCGYSLVAERQKGHVYYRCHNRSFKNPAVCPPTAVREESLDEAIVRRLADIDLSEGELALARGILDRRRLASEQDRVAAMHSLRLQMDQVDSRLSRLADLVADGIVDKGLFTEKQNALLMERARLREKLAEAQSDSGRALEDLSATVELAGSPSLLYQTASPAERRELATTLLSNLVVSGKKIDITLNVPFQLIAERQKSQNGGPCRGTCRTWEETINKLQKHLQEELSNTTL